MKLESDWLFKDILLRFSYISVISRGNILLISSCPIKEVKVGKLPIIASILAILFQNYLKGVEEIWWVFAQLYKNSTHFLCWKSRMWVDFKIVQARRKKIKLLYSYYRNGSSYSWLLITQNLLIAGMPSTRVCMEFNFLNIQVNESQLCL